MYQQSENQVFIQDELQTVTEKLQVEFGVSQLYTLTYGLGVLATGLMLAYDDFGLDPPEELKTIRNTLVSKILNDLRSEIQKEQLMLNTDGTA